MLEGTMRTETLRSWGRLGASRGELGLEGLHERLGQQLWYDPSLVEAWVTMSEEDPIDVGSARERMSGSTQLLAENPGLYTYVALGIGPVLLERNGKHSGLVLGAC